MKATDAIHAVVTFLLYAWPYLSIPLAFSLDRKLRSRWLVEDASRPATGYRSKGTNVQLVLTAISQGASPSAATAGNATALSALLSEEEGQHHEQSRGLDFTNLWPFALLCPSAFVFLAEFSSDSASVLLVCTPFVVLMVFSLTLGQVTILVSILASPVVHVIYGIVNQGAGNAQIHSLLWSQAFVSLTAISLAWSIRDTIKLQETASAIKDGFAVYRAKRRSSTGSGDDSVHKRARRPPESWVIRSAEALLSGVSSSPSSSSSDDEDRAVETLSETMRLARQHGQPVDSLVLQTEGGLRAWREVVDHYAEVERCIRETNRWGALEETLTNMNAGMPFMVGIVQSVLLGASQLQGSKSFGSGSLGVTFYGSVVAYVISLVASIFLLFRVIGLIDCALYGLNAATSETEAVMEASVDTRSWRVLGGGGDIGCLSHIAARRGMVRALGILVEHGADPRVVDSTGKTPLGIVREVGMSEASAYLESVVPIRENVGGSTMSPRRGPGSVGRIWRKWRGGRRVSPLLEEKRSEILPGVVEGAIEYGTEEGRSASRFGDGDDADARVRSGVLEAILGRFLLLGGKRKSGEDGGLLLGASREWATGAMPARAARDGSGGFTVDDPDIETPSMDVNTPVRHSSKEEKNSLSRQAAAVTVDETREKTHTAPWQSDAVVGRTDGSNCLTCALHEAIRRGDITRRNEEGVESLTIHGRRTFSRNGSSSNHNIDHEVVLGKEERMGWNRCKGSSNSEAGSGILSEIGQAAQRNFSCWKRGRAEVIGVEPTSVTANYVVGESPIRGTMRVAEPPFPAGKVSPKGESGATSEQKNVTIVSSFSMSTMTNLLPADSHPNRAEIDGNARAKLRRTSSSGTTKLPDEGPSSVGDGAKRGSNASIDRTPRSDDIGLYTLHSDCETKTSERGSTDGMSGGSSTTATATASATARDKKHPVWGDEDEAGGMGSKPSPIVEDGKVWMESKTDESPEKGKNTRLSFRVIGHRRRRSTTRIISGTRSERFSSDSRNPAGAFAAAAACSPTQSVLNISWGLRRLRPMSTPRERRAAWKTLRETSPFHIPAMYLLPFVDLVALGEIPKRTGDRFWGHAGRRPIPCWEIQELSSGSNGEREPLVAYVSHRWLEPDFKNPDDHTKARFYQVCYSAQKLAKRKGRRPCDIYLWIDYACINQQDPTADQLALPYILDSCDVMLYIEDEDYWEQALSRTEHFLFHRLRRLRRLAKGAAVMAATTMTAAAEQDEDVFSLSWDGERLTQRTYAETRSRFAHNPAKGVLKTETDRLYLWTLVLALEYEDASCLSYPAENGGESCEEHQPALMRIIHDAVSLGNSGKSCGEPEEPASGRTETGVQAWIRGPELP